MLAETQVIFGALFDAYYYTCDKGLFFHLYGLIFRQNILKRFSNLIQMLGMTYYIVGKKTSLLLLLLLLFDIFLSVQSIFTDFSAPSKFV